MFEVQPQHIANRLMAVHKLALQLDRVVGPRHPSLVAVGRAWATAQELSDELADLGFLLVLDETEGVLAVRRRRPGAGGGGAAGGGAAGGVGAPGGRAGGVAAE